MTKDTQILVRLEEEQKQKWKSHAQENDQYRDLTNLVEQAVEKQIADDSADQTLESELMIMAQEIEQLHDQVSEVQEISERIEETQATSVGLERTAERLENIARTREED